MSGRQPVQRIPSGLGYPFSTAVRSGDTWELSGQVGLDTNGDLVPGGVAPETQQCLENIRGVLAEVGCSMSDLVKVSVFLTDIADFAPMNQVYATFFDPQEYPARSTVAVAGLALGAHVEIECSAQAR